MHKQIRPALIRSNKTKSLFFVKPFHRTAAHWILLGSRRPENRSLSLPTSNKARPEGYPRAPLTPLLVKQPNKILSSFLRYEKPVFIRIPIYSDSPGPERNRLTRERCSLDRRRLSTDPCGIFVFLRIVRGVKAFCSSDSSRSKAAFRLAD
jgi:hypothetical protein